LKSEVFSGKDQLQGGSKSNFFGSKRDGVGASTSNIANLMSQAMAAPVQSKQEDYKWTPEVRPIRDRFDKELRVLELLMKQNRSTLHQDHIMMSIQTLETTELIREVNQVISDGCKLTLEGDVDTDRKTEK